MRGKVEACEYTTSDVCQCNRTIDVNFTDHIKRNVLLARIYDADIRRETIADDTLLYDDHSELE